VLSLVTRAWFDYRCHDVQERLGQARGSITLDIYGRVLSGRRAEGTARMTEVMQSSDIAFTLADSELPSRS
jgi:hypothetical protein